MEIASLSLMLHLIHRYNLMIKGVRSIEKSEEPLRNLSKILEMPFVLDSLNNGSEFLSFSFIANY